MSSQNLTPLRSFATLAMAYAMTLSAAAMEAPTHIPFIPDRWHVQGDVTFARKEGFPQGLVTLSGDDPDLAAELDDVSFGDGTIEFDAKATTDGEVGVVFRKHGAASAEIFYVRVGPNCPASQDCLQYAPIMHGRMLWDSYIGYQRSAPFLMDQWNHIKLVLSGRRMNVFVNHQIVPALSVGHLESDATAGGISLRGPASYANLVMTPGATEGLSPEPEADPTGSDARYLRNWDIAPPTRLAEGAEPKAKDVPPASAPWASVHAEDGGLINLARRNEAHLKDHTLPLIGWMKTTVQSDRDQVQHVSIGFLREVWVFVDGKLVYSGRNLYNTPGQRKDPDGRLSLENGSFDLPLHKGATHIVVALRSNTEDMRDRYGWGMEMRLHDLDGVTTTH